MEIRRVILILITLTRPLAKRIDGHFIQCDRLDRVIIVSQVNMEPISDGNLLLSDHIGVMATLDLDGPQRR